jgi:branched-chain amino acid transport system permease protein
MTAFVRSNAALVAVGVVGIVLLIGLPFTLDLYTLLQVTLYVIFAILALSLAFIWGYGGILCFGHSVFFGLGAYAYAVSVINIVVNSTAGPQYHIGEALLGGFNGMPNVPSLNVPFQPDNTLEPAGMFTLCMAILLIVYFGLHAVLRTRFGRVLVAVRENEQRVEFLGYDSRLHKLVAFSIGGALAGLAGCLFTAWGNFVSPTAFSVAQSAQIIIWLMVGGAGTLLGPVIGAMAISWLTLKIGTQQTVNANVVLGAILLVFVILVPKGVAPMITERLVPWLVSLRRPAASPRSVAQESKA